MRDRGRPAGFTLLEVTVALVIGGMAVAGAAALFHGLGQRAEAVERAARRADRDANAERLLRALLANVDFSGDTSSPAVAGDQRTMTFRTWCEQATGWLGRCSVRLFFEQDAGASSLRLDLTGAETITTVLQRGLREGRLRYLVDARQGGTWVDTWTRRGVPMAVAVIIGRDTLLLPVWGGG
jgi:prepilin-type N-terminal cleavage/methylation domain-containing protein